VAAAKKAVKKAAKKVPAKKAANRVKSHGEGVDPTSTYGQRLARRTEENLTPAMKHRRDVFIREYLRDFNGAQAWLRMKAEVDPQDAHKHYTPAQAAEHAYQLRNEPYVAKRIAELVDAMDAANVISQQRVLAMLVREAELQGIGAKHAARVAAQKVLVDVLGMSSAAKAAAARVPSGPGGNGLPRGGVMVVPDVAGDVESWEAAAADAQARLKQEVRE
jgi:hypothetical protein